jgi:prepilin-type N-terminal cleavage/methylation domain-containing protein
MRSATKGFTLIELLVVIAIVGILAAVAIPQFAVYRARGFNARVATDARSAATAEEAAFVDSNAYAAGDCSSLVGMTNSGGRRLHDCPDRLLEQSSGVHGRDQPSAGDEELHLEQLRANLSRRLDGQPLLFLNHAS